MINYIISIVDNGNGLVSTHMRDPDTNSKRTANERAIAKVYDIALEAVGQFILEQAGNGEQASGNIDHLLLGMIKRALAKNNPMR